LKDAEAAGREPARTAYVFRLLTLFAEGEQTDLERPALPKPMQQVLDYINANYANLHSMDDIAEATHISCSTLNRWFRTYLQLSPHKYVEALKLSYAQRLLLEGRTVTDVCNCSGFTDCSRFISVFKNKFGQTPLQYQKCRDR
jgi:AraC-like DNA-binding protein